MLYVILGGGFLIIVVVVFIMAAIGGGLGSGGGPSGPYCFPAGTKVMTLTGSKSIETVKCGESILCWHPDNQDYGWGVVTRVVDEGTSDELATIHFHDGGTIRCSPTQHLLVEDEWKLVANLLPGDMISGKAVQDIKVNPWGKQVFDFEVDPCKNYVVLTSTDAQVISHDYSSVASGVLATMS